MAFDGIFLHSLLNNIKDTLLDSKIDKINQPEKDEIILTIRKNRKNLKFLISSSSKFPRIHFTEINKENPIKAPMYLMVLRKYILGGKIVDVYQKDFDRIVIMDIEASDEMGFNSIYSLIIEIMGRHSNITLVRKRDNKIMDSIKHITPDINSYRVLYPGIEYVYPPESTKLNPATVDLDSYKAYINDNQINYDENFFSNVFTGVSRPLSKKIYSSIEDNNVDYNYLYQYIHDLVDSLKESTFSILTDDDGIYKDFNCISLPETKNIISYESPSKMLDNFFYTKDKQERLSNRSIDLQKLIHTNIDRCNKKTKILNKNISDAKKKEEYKINGDLLTSYIYMIKPNQTKIDLVNFYSENGETVTIKLDPNKSPSENIQSYYKKYNKLKKSEEWAYSQLEKNQQELDYLNSVLTNIINVETYNGIDDIKKELMETGYIRFKSSKKGSKKQKEEKPNHFISSTGLDIYVGKNNIQNDYLSLKFANKNDLWLHTKDIPGSHVIIKSTNVDEDTLKEAATLAAYYSKGKNGNKIPVDYTLVKNLKKPNGAKPGMVIYLTNKTFLADPSKFNELNITKVE